MEWDESHAEDAGFGDEWRALRAAAGEGRRFTGRWTVYFFMSWDTDALGMPQTLRVSVDDSDGTVTQVTPD
jgi:hypothetical protein